jgi:hypothetical protein
LKLNYDKLLSNFAFNFELRRYTAAPADPQAASAYPGKAVQVDPIKPTLKPTANEP